MPSAGGLGIALIDWPLLTNTQTIRDVILPVATGGASYHK